MWYNQFYKLKIWKKMHYKNWVYPIEINVSSASECLFVTNRKLCPINIPLDLFPPQPEFDLTPKFASFFHSRPVVWSARLLIFSIPVFSIIDRYYEKWNYYNLRFFLNFLSNEGKCFFSFNYYALEKMSCYISKS